MFERILVCTDGSERSLKAVRTAMQLAKSARAEVTLLHVCEVPFIAPAFPGAPTLEGPLLDHYVQALHQAVVKRSLATADEFDARVKTLLETGHPAEVIARIANTQGFDLVVLGSRGVSADKAEKLGSVCHGVIHNAYCPVLIVR